MGNRFSTHHGYSCDRLPEWWKGKTSAVFGISLIEILEEVSPGERAHILREIEKIKQMRDTANLRHATPELTHGNHFDYFLNNWDNRSPVKATKNQILTRSRNRRVPTSNTRRTRSPEHSSRRSQNTTRKSQNTTRKSENTTRNSQRRSRTPEHRKTKSSSPKSNSNLTKRNTSSKYLPR